jgi:hypothetical protein
MTVYDETPSLPKPVDVTRIVDEVREEFSQREPVRDTHAMPLEGSAADEDKALLALAVQRHLENQEVLARPQVASHGATQSASDLDAELPGLATRITQGEDFEHNREQLYHPPMQASGGRLKIIATVITVALVVMVLYAAYVNGLFNPVLPDTMQYHPTGLQPVE